MRSIRLPVFLFLIAAVAVAVLLPGVNGPFLFDDYVNIAQNPAFQVDDWTWEAIRHAALTNTSGPFGRPVSTLSFAMNAAVFGLTPFSLKLTNLLLHGVTAVLITLLVLRLCESAPSNLSLNQRRLAALLAGFAWAVHPIAVTSTLYIVQRMNLLSALFTVAALLACLQARRHFFLSRARGWVWIGIAALLWLVGLLSKENALLLPVYVVLVEWLIFDFRDDAGHRMPRWRRAVIVAAAAAVFLASLLFFLTWDRWAAGYMVRSFTLVERLLTELRVLWQYVAAVMFPSHGRLGLFLDDIPVSTGLFAPLSTFIALLCGVFTVTLAVLVRRRMPLVAFGLLFFLAGHLLESTVFALEIAFEHRNYLPSAGLLIAFAAGMQHLATRLRVPILEWLPVAAFGVFLAAFTVIRSLHWADAFMLAQLESFHHPASARAQAELGNEYMIMAHRARANGDTSWTDFYYEESVIHLKDAAALDQDSRNALITWFLNAHLLDKPFPDDMYEEILQRLRTGTPTADTPGHLNNLFQCLEIGCADMSAQIEEILHAALDNPRVQGRQRSEVMVVAAKFFRDVRKDPEWALYWLASAAQNSPGIPRFRIFLARQLAAMGRKKEALEELDIAAAADTFGAYNQDVRSLRDEITRTMN